MISIGVRRGVGRAVVALSGGRLAPKVLHCDERGARVALVATSALLLAGDDVQMSIDIGPGCWLDLVDIAGTVAYHGRGGRAGWAVHAVVAEEAIFTWRGEPFVVADGADVTRSFRLTLADTAVACLRETLVLGRAGESGGVLDAATVITVGDRPVLTERLDLRVEQRRRPGVLGAHRVVDSAILIGRTAPGVGAARVYALAGCGVVARYLGAELHLSPVPATYDAWSAIARASVAE